MLKLDCPHCGAVLEPKDGLDTFFCTYCGGKIIISEMSDAAYQARVDIKKLEKNVELHKTELEHKALMKDKEHQQERFNFKRIIILLILMPVISLGPLGLMYLVSSIPHRKEIKKLEKTESQIIEDIDNQNYDSALLKANQLYYTSNWSSEEEKAWNDKRENYINLILEKKRENDINGEYIAVPASADDLKGEKYSKVAEKLKKAGFTNVSAQKTIKSKGLFDWSDTVEHVSISGKEDFIKGETYENNSRIIIYYYSKE